MTRRDNRTRWRAKGLWMDVLELLGSRNGDGARINN